MFHTPAHKQTNPAALPAQIVPVAPPSYETLVKLVKAIRANCRHNPQAPADVLADIDGLISRFAPV
jgi:hypothetical protein